MRAHEPPAMATKGRADSAAGGEAGAHQPRRHSFAKFW